MEQVAREVYGVEMKPGPFGVNSRMALIGAKVAEAMGEGDAFHDRVMRACWDEAQDIGDRQTLTEIALAVGLDVALFNAGLDDPLYEKLVDEDIRMATQYGLNGVPAMIIANKYLISGAQPPDTMRQIADKVLALQAGDAA